MQRVVTVNHSAMRSHLFSAENCRLCFQISPNIFVPIPDSTVRSQITCNVANCFVMATFETSFTLSLVVLFNFMFIMLIVFLQVRNGYLFYTIIRMFVMFCGCYLKEITRLVRVLCLARLFVTGIGVSYPSCSSSAIVSIRI